VNHREDPFDIHVVITTPGNDPVALLHQACGLPKQRIKHAMHHGAVWITRGRRTQRLRRAKRALRAGDELHLYHDAAVLAQTPAAPTLIADIGEYSVWNKPYGLRSQGSKWGDHCTVTRWAEQHLEPRRPAFVVHRLDRAANGLILVAHSKGMAGKLAALFRQRAVDKHYLAVVTGDLRSQPDPMRVAWPLGGKEAISEFSVRAVGADCAHSLLDVRIETGRKHQIRRHLADIGHPVVGDRLYGSIESHAQDLQLTAYRLAFRCPVAGEAVDYRLPDACLPRLPDAAPRATGGPVGDAQSDPEPTNT
jgi:tRNA pseudouridine32 synthase/23S rRNA pseudouridine746 synthase